MVAVLDNISKIGKICLQDFFIKKAMNDYNDRKTLQHQTCAHYLFRFIVLNYTFLQII